MKRDHLIRRLAEQAAADPRIEAAVLGAIRASLPDVLEGLIRQAAAAEGGQLRVYLSKRSQGERERRDEFIAGLLAQGTPPPIVAARVGCSLRHVYIVRRRLEVADAPPPG
jgi:hypothetical protein